ncbi:3-methyl-2-oxobutanoate dehydrogenase subunit VorB [Metallumcola ferriviriculae]|uniref:3-methyl-2-oxobutanoate dehydrogenase subunit VorB n=1 Tax=Metallumcola ferriviriculae TaxID=3039180 RepID=A0AAU0UJH9_9FIRM|nr:3-methyl-2-oxobutanoate dehydrogenase subunit VorB [Desulfitibacteraceae bacterium MK1]
MTAKLMKGNTALGEAAIQAGCRYFFGYPITPQTELPEYLAKRLPETGGVFLQAESEIAAINMVYGAAAAGGRVMTSSSSPGISLKQEGISYIAAAELPCVIANVMRCGPGLGGIQPAQSDYFQATKGGGHGDYRLIVLAPDSVQEIYDLTLTAFQLAHDYRNPVMLLGDGLLGQMMEPVRTYQPTETMPTDSPAWATTGCEGRKKRIVNTLYLDPPKLEEHNCRLQEKYATINDREQRAEAYRAEDASVILVAFGMAARIAKEAVDMARSKGIKAGLIRPITLWPFPQRILQQHLDTAKALLTVEMNTGQMLEDVKLSVNGEVPVHFYGRSGGMLPSSQAILEKIVQLWEVQPNG